MYDDLTGESRSYLHDDYSLDCDSAEYKRARKWAIALITLWPVGIPVLYLALLVQSGSAIRHNEPSALSRATRFLYSEYTQDLFW